MIVAKIKISEASALTVWAKPITAGMIGAEVQIEYDGPEWAGLTKTVVFSGAVVKDWTTDDSIVEIPAECLARAGVALNVGVFGFRADDKKIVIPTVETRIGRVLRGTDPSGDEETNPSLPVWAQILDKANTAEQIAQDLRKDAAAGRFDGAPGADGHTPEKGVDYFTPAEVAGIEAGAAAKLEPKLSKLKKDIAAEAKRAKEAEDNRIKKFYTGNLGAVNIEDSDDGAVRNLVIGGRSEQVQTNGYQKLNLASVRDNQGLSVSIDNGVISFSGAIDASSPVRLYLGGDLTLNGTYSFKDFSGFTNRAILYYASKNSAAYVDDLIKGDPETFADITFNCIGFSVPAGIYSNQTIKPMIEAGDTVHDWEPYTGGIPSPSPDYPQEIKSVENCSGKIFGKNLWNEKWENGYRNSDTGKKVNSPNAIRTVDPIRVNPQKSYYAHMSGFTVIKLYAQFYTKDGSYIKQTEISNKAFVPPENAWYLHFNTDVAVMDYTGQIQIEYGTKYTGYIKYTEQSFAIPFTLRGIGDVRDELYVYADGTGKLVQRIKHRIITADDEICVSGMSTENFKDFGVKSIKDAANQNTNLFSNAISNRFSRGKRQGFNVKNTVFYGGNNNDVIYFCLPTEVAQSVDDFREFVANNTVEILYEINPIEVALTAEQVKALFDLRTYYGGTNVSFESENGVEPVVNYDYACALDAFVEYIKAAQGDDRKIIYDMDERMTDAEYVAALAYVNSEYATALTELEV